MKFYIIENLLRAERSPEISLPLPTDFSSKLSLFFSLKILGCGCYFVLFLFLISLESFKKYFGDVFFTFSIRGGGPGGGPPTRSRHVAQKFSDEM